MSAAPSAVGFAHRRDLDRALRRVGERLDERRVVGHAAVDAQRRDRDAGVGLGRLDEIRAALGDAFEHCAHDVRARRTRCQAEQRAACAVVPGRRAETEERGHEHDAVGVRAPRRRARGFRRPSSEADLVAEPLHVGARREHDRFDAVRRRVPRAPGDDRERAVRGRARRTAADSSRA